MKSKKISLLLILLLTISFSCKGLLTKKIPTLVHTVNYSGKGTRSEARHGSLTYAQFNIPDAFTNIAHMQKAFHFYTRKTPWGKDGYFPVDPSLLKRGSTYFLIPDEELETGYYMGRVQYVDTPKSWLFVTWHRGSAFVAPEAIEKLIKEKSLKILKRQR